MMKKILSVALSVIMMLSLIAVPGLAAEPASAAVVAPAVEYTVSAVTYTKAGSTLTASVDVTASTADNKVSVIYAVLQDGALESAEFETKTVGTSKVNFNKALTFDAAKSYKIFVVESATGRAIAPEANYPTHENALAYVDVTYGSGEKERHIVEGDTITLLHTPEREAAGNPTFKFVPVDNSSKIVAEGGRDFWAQKKTVTVTGLDGDVKTYTVEANTIRLTFKPTVSNDYLYENLGGSVMYKTAVDSVNVAFGKADKEITVDVPAGTSQVMMSSFESGNIKIPGATITLSAAKATHTFTINEEEYKIHLRWDVNAPGIYNVTRDFKAPERSFFLRANGKSLYAQHGLQKTDMQKVGTSVGVKGGDALAGDSANMNLTILKDGVDTPLRNDASTLALVHTTAETANRQIDAIDSSVDKITGSWMKGNATGEWFKFTPTAAGTVYVRATQADAMTEGYKWNEITNEDGTLKDGWYEVAGAKLSGTAIKLFAKDFEADEPVMIPTQAFDRDEYKYVARTLGLAMTDYSEGSIPGITSQSNKSFFRASNIYSTGKTTGYNAFVLISFDAELSGDQYDPAAPGADQLDLWYSTSAAISEPATQTATAANIAGNNSIYAGGIYKVAASDYMEAEVNQTAKTFEIVVPYGTEVVNLAVSDKAGNAFAGESYNLLSRGGTQNASVKIGPADAQITYRGTIKWAAFDANAMSENAPLVYNLKYNMEGKELVGDTTYSVMPTRLTLKPAGNPVAGSGVLKGESMDGDVTEWADGTWFTVASHNNGNYTALDNGAHYNKLHISAASFENWVAADTLADAYALDGATLLVADYKDAMTGARYEFTTAKAGYVIAAYAAEQNLPGWTLLADTALATTAGATDAEKDLIKWPPVGHTNPASDFAVWGDSYDYVYIKVVSANEDVVINETASTANMPPVVMVTDKELFTAPTLAGLTYSIGDGAPEAIEIAEGVTTATVNVPFTKEAISVAGEINGTGRAVADRALTLNWDNKADNVITVEVLDVFGNVCETYEIAFEMDFATAQVPAVDTMTYTIGNGAPEAIDLTEDVIVDGTTIKKTIALNYTADEVSVQADITGDGNVDISAPVTFEYPVAEQSVTVTVKDAKTEIVNTYVITFTVNYATAPAPVLGTLSWKTADGAETPIVLADGATTATVEVPWNTKDISLVATLASGTAGSFEYGAPVELTYEDSIAETTVVMKNAMGDEVKTYTITFEWPQNLYLAGANVTTTKSALFVDALAMLSGQAVTFTGTDRTIEVPRGAEKVTFTISNKAGGSSEAVEVTMDAATKVVKVMIGASEYEITLKYGAENPTIYNFVNNRIYDKLNRIAIQYGDLTSTLSIVGKKTNAADASQAAYKLLSLEFANGATKPAKDKDLLVIGAPTADNANAHQVTTTFGWMDPAKATDEGVLFNVSAGATVFVSSSAKGKVAWPSIEALGWEEVGTLAGQKLYAKHFNAGQRVSIPNEPITQAELDAVNEGLKSKNQEYGFVTAADTSLPVIEAEGATGVDTDKVKAGNVVLFNLDPETGDRVSVAGTLSNKKSFPKHYTRDVNKAIYVVFDKPAAMSTISYKVGGVATDITNDFVGTAAEIEVPYGTTDISLEATYTGTGSVEYSAANLALSKENRSGEIVATLKNGDGSVAGTYTVTFTWAAPVAPALATLTYTAGESLPADVMGKLENNAAVIELDYGTANVSLDATITGNGSVEPENKVITLSEEKQQDSIAVTIKDYQGNTYAEYTVTFKWKAREPIALEKLYYVIGNEQTEVELSGNTADVNVPYGTASVSLYADKTGTGTVRYSADSLALSADNRTGELTATLVNYDGTETSYTVTFTWESLSIKTLTYTTSLVDAKKYLTGTTIDAANVHKGGFYKPTLETAKAVTIGEGATIDVTVPYGSEIVTLAGTDSIDTEIPFDAINLIDNNGKATVTKTIDETVYTINVAWAAFSAADAEKNLVYDVQYGLEGGKLTNGTAYNVLPTKLVLSETRLYPSKDPAYDSKGNVLNEAGKWAPIIDAYKINVVAKNTGNNSANLVNRGRLDTGSFAPWVEAGIITASGQVTGTPVVKGETESDEAFNARVDAIAYNAMNGATLFVAWYDVLRSDASTVEYTFKVAKDSVIYVYAKESDLDESWKKFAPDTGLKLYNGDNTQVYYEAEDGSYKSLCKGRITSFSYVSDNKCVFYKYAEAGQTVVIDIKNKNTNSTIPPLVFVREADFDSFDAPTAQSDTEDTGIAAVVADDVASEQGAGTTDVSVSGSDAAYANEVVAVYVLAEGKTMSDLVTLLANPSGDLADPTNGVILAMGKAWADEEGNFTIDLTLPPEAETGSYNIGIVTDTAEQAQLDYVDLDDQVIAFNAIVNAADGIGSMETAFANIAHIINTNDIYVALGADQAVVQNSVKNNAEVIAMNTIAVPTADIAKLAAIIDARIAVEILNNGDATLFDEIKGYVLDNTTLTADALAIYEGDALNAAGKANVLSAITGKNFEVTATQTIQQQVSAAFEQAVFVNLINNTAYNANAVLPNVVKFNSVLRGTNGVAMNAVTLTALAEIMNGEDITGYTDFADRVNVLTAAPSDPVPPTPGDQTGGVANDNRPPQTEGGTTGGGQSYPVGPTTKLLSTFTDANQAAWAATALQTMLDRNILSGYEDNTIRPNNSATRQEVAKMLVEAFSKVRPYAWTGFSDVPAGSWYYSYVATAAEDGIIKGMGDGQFGTDANITREDLSVLIYRFLVNKGIAMNSASTRTFTDAASMSDYAIEAINALTKAGIVNGYTDGSYNAKGNATRAEIAQIIANVLVIYAL